MMFKKRLEQALALLRERRARKVAENPERVDDVHLEKGDKKAMLIAAFLVFIPAAILVLGIMVLVGWLLFFR